MNLAAIEIDTAVLRAWIRGEVDTRHVWSGGMHPSRAVEIANLVNRLEMSELDGAMYLSRMDRLGPDVETTWPHMAIERLKGRTLQQIGELAVKEATALRRFDKHVDRVVEHARRRPGCRCNPGGVWDFWNEYEMLADLHPWTMRILRRSRLPIGHAP